MKRTLIYLRDYFSVLVTVELFRTHSLVVNRTPEGPQRRSHPHHRESNRGPCPPRRQNSTEGRDLRGHQPGLIVTRTPGKRLPEWNSKMTLYL